jgi:CheY-like chemotaxis protein
MAKIMIIDDDPIFAEVTLQRLQTSGHLVEVHDGALGALTAIRLGNFDVVVVDVFMPAIQGTRLTELIRERGQGSPRVVLTSSMDTEELSKLAVKHGADAWVSKSANRAELNAVVSKMIRH